MSLEKGYWLQVWLVLTWQYNPGVPLRKKLRYLLWALLFILIFVPYIILIAMAWVFEKMESACDWASDRCWRIINDTMPKERGNGGCPHS